MHKGVSVDVLEGPYLRDGQPSPEAVVLYDDLIARLPELRRFAATSLLPLYNETWVQPDIGPLDSEAFCGLLSRPSVLVQDELGAALVYFEAGELFAGHSVEVTIQGGKPVSADIVG